MTTVSSPVLCVQERKPPNIRSPLSVSYLCIWSLTEHIICHIHETFGNIPIPSFTWFPSSPRDTTCPTRPFWKECCAINSSVDFLHSPLGALTDFLLARSVSSLVHVSRIPTPPKLLEGPSVVPSPVTRCTSRCPLFQSLHYLGSKTSRNIRWRFWMRKRDPLYPRVYDKTSTTLFQMFMNIFIVRLTNDTTLMWYPFVHTFTPLVNSLKILLRLSITTETFPPYFTPLLYWFTVSSSLSYPRGTVKTTSPGLCYETFRVGIPLTTSLSRTEIHETIWQTTTPDSVRTRRFKHVVRVSRVFVLMTGSFVRVSRSGRDGTPTWGNSVLTLLPIFSGRK